MAFVNYPSKERTDNQTNSSIAKYGEDDWSTNDCRDITWCVEFNICLNGNEIDFSELTDIEKEKILEDIKNDYFCGTF